MAKYDPYTGQIVADTYDDPGFTLDLGVPSTPGLDAYSLNAMTNNIPDVGYQVPGSTITDDFGLDSMYEMAPYNGANGVDIEYPGGYYGGSTLGNWGRSTADLGRSIGTTLGDGLQRGDAGQIGGAIGQWGNDMKTIWNDSPLGQKVSNFTGEVANEWGDLSLGEQANTIWGGLQSLGNMYSKYKAYQLGKDNMRMQKDMWNKTWDANKRQFNEAVSARADSRYNTVDNRDKRQTHKDQYSIK